jgi:poly(beta-D-mannuronate) lyase
MRMIARLAGIGATVVALTLPPATTPAAADEEARWPFDPGDLTSYVVTDRTASYFDVGRRRALLRRTRDPLLRAEAAAYGGKLDCRAARDIRVIDYRVELPRYYADHAAWRAEAEPFFAFEEAISRLAAGYVATGRRRYADCAIALLSSWARRDAMTEFVYDEENKQAWFEVEASAAAAGLAYTILRPVAGADARALVDRWLRRLSRLHIGYPGGDNSCCNNHYYRRALHATAIGVATGDDRLFRYGIRAAQRAVGELNRDGSFPREVARGDRAVHYQNFALLYLIPIFELAERQGYPLYDVEIRGRTIHEAVDRALDLITAPRRARRYTDEKQDLFFADDPEFFTWMEMYNARFPTERMGAILDARRPTYNRRAGGPLTMYFYLPAEAG